MQNFKFTDAEIESACLELGIPKESFSEKNSERRKIIDCWGSANIIACPGSGKTTVLLVKLLLLAKRMPFSDGKGVCVLTHTNVAIDEIKAKLGSSAKAIMEHPNFFGTYQAFIGRFILNKALSEEFSSRAMVVDDDLFYKRLAENYKHIARYSNNNSEDKSLKGFIFNTAYSGSLRVKTIKEEIFPADKDNVAAKKIHEFLKFSGYIRKNGQLVYKKCKSVNLDDFVSFKPLDLDIKELVELRHKDIMRNIESTIQKLATRFWIDRVEDKLYSNHSDMKEGGKSIAGGATATFIALNRLHEKLYRIGYVGFDHAFELSRCYAVKNNTLCDLFSNRFRFLFCDEMQDTQKHQMDLIDALFAKTVVRQAYGDPDQAIYSATNFGGSAWRPSENSTISLTISDSKRYGKKISQCLSPFKRELANIAGNEKVDSERPCIILYDDPEEVLPLFIAEINKRKLTDLSEYKNWRQASSPFNAVGLVGRESGNTTIQSYSENYSKHTNSKKVEFSNLISYFQKRSDSEIQQKGTGVYFDLFMSAFIRSFEETGVRHTKVELLSKFSENEEFINKFRLSAFNWIIKIEQTKTDARLIRGEFLTLLKVWLSEGLQTPFFSDDTIISIDQVETRTNIFSEGDIKIKLGTIHSVKGETHMATLLLDTQNYREFESDLFFKGSCGKLFCGDSYNRPEKAYARLEYRLKTTYVAMSRPTHLLCVALKKESADCPKCVGKIKENCKWEIIPSFNN